MQDGVRQILAKAVLDPGFLDRVRHDPGQTLSAFDLTPEDRAALTAGDRRVLALMGVPGSGAQTPLADTVPEPAPAPLHLRLAVRVLFSLEMGTGGAAEIHFVPVLSMLDAGVSPTDLPPPDLDPALLPGQAAGQASYEIRLVPGLVTGPDGAATVACAHAMLAARQTDPPAPAPPDLAPAARAVHASAGADRAAAILALIEAAEHAHHG